MLLKTFHRNVIKEKSIFFQIWRSLKNPQMDIKASKWHRCLLNLIKFIDLLSLQDNSRLINDVQAKLTFLSKRTKPASMLKY